MVVTPDSFSDLLRYRYNVTKNVLMNTHSSTIVPRKCDYFVQSLLVYNV